MEPFGITEYQECIEHGSDVGLFGILAHFCTMGYDVTCMLHMLHWYMSFDGIGLCCTRYSG